MFCLFFPRICFSAVKHSKRCPGLAAAKDGVASRRHDDNFPCKKFTPSHRFPSLSWSFLFSHTQLTYSGDESHFTSGRLSLFLHESDELRRWDTNASEISRHLFKLPIFTPHVSKPRRHVFLRHAMIHTHTPFCLLLLSLPS